MSKRITNIEDFSVYNNIYKLCHPLIKNPNKRKNRPCVSVGILRNAKIRRYVYEWHSKGFTTSQIATALGISFSIVHYILNPAKYDEHQAKQKLAHWYKKVSE